MCVKEEFKKFTTKIDLRFNPKVMRLWGLFMNKLAYEKREEMIKFIGNILLEDGIKDENGKLAETLIYKFVTIEPPEEPPEPPELVYTIGLMTLNTGGVGGGTSRKFGNVRINLKSLLIGLVGTTGTIASPGQVNLNQSIIDQPLIQDVLNQPIVVSVLAAFLALYEFNKMLSVSITEREATVVWAIWKNKDDNDCVSDQDLIVLVNKERKI